MREEGRSEAAAAQVSKRQVRFNNGGLTINSHLSPVLSPSTSEPSQRFPFPTLAKPFTPFSAKHQPHLNPPLPNPSTPFSAFHQPLLLTSFADLFKKPIQSPPLAIGAPSIPPPSLAKGILPLPPNLQPLPSVADEWTTFVNKKRARRLRSAFSKPNKPLPPKKKGFFFCGNLNHMAKDCKIKSFLCFKCKEVGHTSRSCPLSYQPQSRSTPILSLPQAVKENILHMGKFAILHIKSGDPTVAELREMLEYIFNIKEWVEAIIPASGNSFLIEFPTVELLEKAISSPSKNMGSFDGYFSRWSERRGMHVFTEPVFVWVGISSLPFHLWDSDFLAQLFQGIGQIHTCSRDILLKEEAKDCKVLLKVKCRQDIPPSIPFRYISPSSNWLMEGSAVLKVLGKAVTATDLKSEEGGLFLMREGEPPSDCSMGDFCNNLQKVTEVVHPPTRPFKSQCSPSTRHVAPSRADAKGKGILQHSLDGAGSAEVVKATQVGGTNILLRDHSIHLQTTALKFSVMARFSSFAGTFGTTFLLKQPNKEALHLRAL